MSTLCPSVRPVLTLLASLHLTVALPAGGQDVATATSGIIGRIFDERTNEVLVDVLLFLDTARRDIPISSQGRFVLSNLAPGKHRLEVRAIGYRPYVLDLALTPGQVLERQLPMVFTGDRLPELAVEARNSKLLPRYNDFERRRANGIGAYITRDEIRARGYMSMGDALRTIKGVRVNCGVVECLIHMTRATEGCFPTYYVDGRRARSFAESTPISDVQGIEVYRGAAEMPGEFAGDGAMCGVIAIWTRAAP
jgi:carboxypeptidase family protein/TonB-dependent receptor-like protein